MRAMTVLLLLILMLTTILSACAPKVAPVEKSLAQKPLTLETHIKESWVVEWKRAIAGARKEGKVSVLGAGAAELNRTVASEFKNKFGISVEFVLGRSLQLIEKVMTETRAGIYSYDLQISGPTNMIAILKPAGLLDSIEPELILPEVKDPAAWYENRLFIDTDNKIALMTAGPSAGAVLINTNMVEKDEIRSSSDLLNPKWKGKIVIDDPSQSGPSTMLQVIALGPQGWDYVKKLAEQKPIITRDSRLAMEGVARGKYPVGMTANPEEYRQFKHLSLPIEKVNLSDAIHISESAGNLALFKNAPHPNASKVFINWILSREGADIYSRAKFRQSNRIDVPTDYLSPEEVRQPGVKYFNTTVEDYKKGAKEMLEKIREIFRPLIE